MPKVTWSKVVTYAKIGVFSTKALLQRLDETWGAKNGHDGD